MQFKEVSMADAGVNVSEGVIVAHASELDRLEADKRAAQQQVTAANKRIKAKRKEIEGDGVHLKAFDTVRKMLDDDEDEMLAFYRHMGAYLRAYKHTMGHQFDLFDKSESPPQSEIWLTQGYQVGVRGGNLDENPHHRGDKGFKPWEEGYQAGQKVLAAGLADIHRDPDEDDAAEGQLEDGAELEAEEAEQLDADNAENDGFEDEAEGADEGDDILDDEEDLLDGETLEGEDAIVTEVLQ
jgi:hypothetical protein